MVDNEDLAGVRVRFSGGGGKVGWVLVVEENNSRLLLKSGSLDLAGEDERSYDPVLEQSNAVGTSEGAVSGNAQKLEDLIAIPSEFHLLSSGLPGAGVLGKSSEMGKFFRRAVKKEVVKW